MVWEGKQRPTQRWDLIQAVPKGKAQTCRWVTLLLVCSRNVSQGTSQVVQWLGLCTSTAGSLGSIPGWGRYCKSSGQKKKMWARSSSCCYSVTKSCRTLENYVDCSLKTGTYFHSWGQSPSSLGREGLSSWYHSFPFASARPHPCMGVVGKARKGSGGVLPSHGVRVSY